MSHKVYTTEAIVCGSRHSNTSDRSFLLFTREAGMLWASARSVREERSKQRYALQDFSIIRVSLVRGKSGWRIGSVEGIENVFSRSSNRETRGAVTRLIKLLRQFVHGEEPQPKLFDDLVRAIRLLLSSEQVDPNIVADLCTLRSLYLLGYISNQTEFKNVLEEDWLSNPSPLSEKANKAIEQAYHASHL